MRVEYQGVLLEVEYSYQPDEYLSVGVAEQLVFEKAYVVDADGRVSTTNIGHLFSDEQAFDIETIIYDNLKNEGC